MSDPMFWRHVLSSIGRSRKCRQSELTDVVKRRKVKTTEKSRVG